MVLTNRLAPSVVEELILLGDGCKAERARDLGVVTKVAEAELARLASKPAAAFRASKRYLFGDLWRRMSQTFPEDDEIFLECWFADETQQRIAATVDRLGG